MKFAKKMRLLPILFMLLELVSNGDIEAQGSYFCKVFGADMVVLRTGGTCHRNKSIEKTLFRTDEPEKVIEVIGLVDLVQENSSETLKDKEFLHSNCLCCGTHTFEFYKNRKIILEFSLHHGTQIRSPQINNGRDTALSPESQKKISRFISSH